MVRARRTIIIAGAVAGAIVGPTGLWLHTVVALNARSGNVSVAGRTVEWAAMFDRLTGSAAGIATLLVPFVATLALMPAFVRVLERHASRPAGGYYARAAGAGIVLGIGATAVISIGLFWAALIWGTMHPVTPDQAAATGEWPALIGGGLVFGFITAMVTPLLFAPYIVLFGIPFGLGFGAAIRRLAPALQQEAPHGDR